MSKLKDLLSGITPAKIASEATGSLVGKIMEGADALFTSKDEKLKREIEITEAINKHNENIVNATLKETEMALADIADAREANVKIQESDKASWWAKNTAYFLDVFIGLIWGFLTVFIIAKAFKLTGANASMTEVLSIYSTVTAVFMISVNFHRGSSVGSKQNGDALRTAFKKQNESK